jgi:hypothetical protein
MYKCHLDHKVATELGYDFFRVYNDMYGNPRYVISFLAFANDYDEASLMAKDLGFRKYRGHDFGGGFVIASHNLESVAEQIIKARK